jgi:hypothetical protein
MNTDKTRGDRDYSELEQEFRNLQYCALYSTPLFSVFSVVNS